MGTNYYAEVDSCPACKRPMESFHIGKSSVGWPFLFRKDSARNLTSWALWRSLLDEPNVTIRDEYGVVHDPLSVFTFAEVCQTLRVSDKTLRGIIERGELPGVKVGSTWRVRSDDLEAYLCPSTNAAMSGTTTSPSRATATGARPASKTRPRPARSNNAKENARPWAALIGKS